MLICCNRQHDLPVPHFRWGLCMRFCRVASRLDVSQSASWKTGDVPGYCPPVLLMVALSSDIVCGSWKSLSSVSSNDEGKGNLKCCSITSNLCQNLLFILECKFSGDLMKSAVISGFRIPCSGGRCVEPPIFYRRTMFRKPYDDHPLILVFVLAVLSKLALVS